MRADIETYHVLCADFLFKNYIVYIFSHHRAPVESMETGSANPTAMVVGGGKGFADPSEPIYTDPSLFERSRSLRSIAYSSAGQNVFKNEAFCHWFILLRLQYFLIIIIILCIVFFCSMRPNQTVQSHR